MELRATDATARESTHARANETHAAQGERERELCGLESEAAAAVVSWER